LSKFSSFMKKPDESELKVNVADRFVDDEGKPDYWRLRVLDNDEYEQIRSDVLREINGDLEDPAFISKFQDSITVASVVYPDLRDAELQDFFEVNNPVALLRAMLIPGELQLLEEKVLEIHGLTKTLDQMVVEAKN
jgi:hypothetical protein